MAKKKHAKTTQRRPTAGKQSVGMPLRKPTCSYEVGQRVNEFVYWGICALTAPSELVLEIRQRALDSLIAAWLRAVTAESDRIRVDSWVGDANEQFKRLLTSSEYERFNELAPRIFGRQMEIGDASDAVEEWINPFAVEIARIEGVLFEQVCRTVNPRHVPLVRLGALMDRFHHPNHSRLVTLRVVNAQICRFRPTVHGAALWGANHQQREVFASENSDLTALSVVVGTPDLATSTSVALSIAAVEEQITISQAIEHLSRASRPPGNMSANPAAAFVIPARGLLLEDAHVRDQYEGVQHALSEIADSITTETKSILPSDDFIRKATATEICTFVARWVSALHQSPAILGQIVAEFESATPEYAFLDVWVNPRLCRAGRRGVAEMVAIKSSDAALLLTLMVNDPRGHVSYQTALDKISPQNEDINDVYKAKSKLKGSVAELRLRIKTKRGVGYTLAGL